METLLIRSTTFRNQGVWMNVGNYDVMVLLEEKSDSKPQIITINYLGTMNAFTSFNGKPSNSC